MPLPAQSYVWFRLRHVVSLWIQRETGLPDTGIVYDMQNQPRPALPYIGIERRDFPFSVFDDELIKEITTAATLQVSASVAGETAALLLFGTRYAYTLQVGDTTEDARDALLAAIAVDLCRIVTAGDGTDYAVGFQPCTATSAGLDSIDFAGLGLGPSRVIPVEGCTLSSTTEAYRSIQSGMRRMVVRLMFYWPEKQDGFETIDAYAEALRSSLVSSDTAEWLQARGVGVEMSSTVSIQPANALSGGARQRRKMMDVIFNANSVIYRADNGLVDANAPSVEVLAP